MTDQPDDISRDSLHQEPRPSRRRVLKALVWLGLPAVAACGTVQAGQEGAEPKRPHILLHISGSEPTRVWIDGEEFTEVRITQVWGKCRCEQSKWSHKGSVKYLPGPTHSKWCPRYRRKPFGNTR